MSIARSVSGALAPIALAVVPVVVSASDKGGSPGAFGTLNLPTEVVSSEYLTMEGKKFSSSRRVVIYVRDFLERYDADALRSRGALPRTPPPALPSARWQASSPSSSDFLKGPL